MNIQVPEGSNVTQETVVVDGVVHTRVVITGPWEPYKEKDQRPHSRACGVKPHAHGSACSTNCQTCHGKD